MKKIILFPCSVLIIILFPLISIGQKQKISLFETIKQLIPDSSSQQQLGDWNTLQANKSITWIGNFSCCNVTGIIVCAPVKIFEDIDNWGLTVNGNKEGYTDFDLYRTGNYDGKTNNVLDALFGNENYKASIFKSCEKTVMYTLIYPGKKIVWCQFMFSENDFNRNPDIRIDVYLTAKGRDNGNNCN